jgi:hypothetical protein
MAQQQLRLTGGHLGNAVVPDGSALTVQHASIRTNDASRQDDSGCCGGARDTTASSKSHREVSTSHAGSGSAVQYLQHLVDIGNALIERERLCGGGGGRGDVERGGRRYRFQGERHRRRWG